MGDYVQFTFYDPKGQKLKTATDIASANWVRTTNSLGSATINVSALQYDFSTYTQENLGLLIETGEPLVPDLDTFWFLRGFSESRQNDQEILSLKFEDSMTLLNRRIVSLKANSPEGSETRTELSGPGNTIMAEIFRTVTGLNGNGRNWSNNVSVAPIAEPAPIIEKEVPWKVLLQVMQQIARSSLDKGTPLYFDMIPKPPYTFEFTTYIGQRGRNHTEIINTENPSFLLDSFSTDYNVPNTGYVGGAGKGANRKLGFAQAEVDGIFGIFERFKSTNVTKQTILDDEASELVNGASGKVALTGKLVGDLANRFGWGDRVTVQHRDFLVDCEIASVRTSLSSQVFDRDITVRSL